MSIEKYFNSSPFLNFFKKKIEENNFSFLLEELDETQKSLLIFLLYQNVEKDILIISDGLRRNFLFENLSFFLPEEKILQFPALEGVSLEEASVDVDILGKRIQILDFLKNNKGKSNFVILSPLQSILQKTIPANEINDCIYRWELKTNFDFNKIEEFLNFLGYKKVSTVFNKGEFAVRGGIIDLFSPVSYNPCRIEFVGNEINSIRTFDCSSQRSLSKESYIMIVPADEEKMINLVGEGSFLEYLEKEPILIFDGLTQIENSYIALKNNKLYSKYYSFTLSDFFNKEINCSKIYFSDQKINELSSVKVLHKDQNKFFNEIEFEFFNEKIIAQLFFHSFHTISNYFYIDVLDEKSIELKDYLNKFLQRKIKIIFVVENNREKETILALISKDNMSLIEFEKGGLTSGFVISDMPIAIIPFSEFTHIKKISRPKWRDSTYKYLPEAEFHKLEIGEYVVHFHSGIGKYLGIERQIDNKGKENEFLLIEYADNAKLFVPISQSYLISKYIGAKEQRAPNINELGSKKWQKTKLTAQKQIKGYACELLNIYAERSVRKGICYPKDSSLFIEFEKSFPYTETDDQKNAINLVKEDMTSIKSMDRLICGDVGYGKTEVAMRAACKAVLDGKKQVILLVPTTILAMQHYDSFRERAYAFPINIAALSRFNTPTVNKNILKKVENGEIDILIGTHRILSKDVFMKDLGLVIIDEEQRFGVKAKEHLKKIKKNVDCLTLSATPIPRTLYISLMKIRDLSTINTPPQDRLPVKTFLMEEEEGIIKSAILQELSRQGQVFIIHNRVDSIMKKKQYIQQLIPSAKIAVVHGQMKSNEIDKIFHEFKSAKTDILVATTLIENGIDIPNANTIIIYRADNFGLSDLYQLRGRVGRWNRTAYAYFIVPKNKELKEITKKRLSALLESTGYGGGMKIAMRDLEIRGAGDLLGTKQSGEVSSIGFHLYCRLLKKAIASMTNKKDFNIMDVIFEFPFEAKLTNAYVPDTNLRMEIYYRLGDIDNLKDLEKLFDELKDRFGSTLPHQVIWLYHMTKVRIFAAMNHFIFLKIQRTHFIMEQKIQDKVLKKTIKIEILKNPKDMEEYLIEALKNNFKCAKTNIINIK